MRRRHSIRKRDAISKNSLSAIPLGDKTSVSVCPSIVSGHHHKKIAEIRP